MYIEKEKHPLDRPKTQYSTCHVPDDKNNMLLIGASVLLSQFRRSSHASVMIKLSCINTPTINSSITYYSFEIVYTSITQVVPGTYT